MSRLDDVKDGEGRVACSIRYDPDTANGYEEAEEREVTFIDEHELWDLEEGEILLWRREGDQWEGLAPVPEQGEEDDGTVDIVSLCREEERRMRLMGHDTDTDLVDMLQHLVPQERRRDVAACYRMGEEIFRYARELSFPIRMILTLEPISTVQESKGHACMNYSRR